MNRTKEEFDKEIKSISDVELIGKADKILSDLCSTGGKAFRMCVPPEVNDTDIILAELITRFKSHLTCQAENEGKFTEDEIKAALHKAELQHGKDYSGIWTNMLLFLQSLKK